MKEMNPKGEHQNWGFHHPPPPNFIEMIRKSTCEFTYSRVLKNISFKFFWIEITFDDFQISIHRVTFKLRSKSTSVLDRRGNKENCLIISKCVEIEIEFILKFASLMHWIFENPWITSSQMNLVGVLYKRHLAADKKWSYSNNNHIRNAH